MTRNVITHVPTRNDRDPQFRVLVDATFVVLVPIIFSHQARYSKANGCFWMKIEELDFIGKFCSNLECQRKIVYISLPSVVRYL